MLIFRVKSVKNLHRPKKIYKSILVALVTNIRYGQGGQGGLGGSGGSGYPGCPGGVHGGQCGPGGPDQIFQVISLDYLYPENMWSPWSIGHLE